MSGTRAALPPAKSRGAAAPTVPADPETILDEIDSYIPKASSSSKLTAEQPDFDPIEFLNKFYATESSLVSHLPQLRRSVQDRITTLDDSISNAIQRQAERGDQTATDVSRAKASIQQLHRRIQLIQSKAATSEQTVLDITRDMKRLDYAKKHLQQTITALKRLHMLIYAVDQLTECVSERPIPRFQEAAHLVDATRLLLKHFDNYQSIAQIRRIQYTIKLQRKHLEDYVFEAFTLGTTLVPSRAASSSNPQGEMDKPPPRRSRKKPERALTPLEAREMAAKMLATPDPHQEEEEEEDDGDGDETSDSEEESESETESEDELEEVFTLPMLPLDCQSLSEACMVMDALGPDMRAKLIQTFCENQLLDYQKLFQPKAGSNNMNRNEKSMLGRMKGTSGSRGAYSVGDSESGEDPTSLDQVERRFAWFRRLLRSVEEAYPNVFPPHWRLQYELTGVFMKQVSYYDV
jgi:hypothetical protein